MRLAVQDPGPQTTVQDQGRIGYLRVGIPTSGPMDGWAFAVGNRLVGNREGAAGLECTLVGPRVEFADERLVAVTGAEMPVTLNGAEILRWAAFRVRAGDVLKLGSTRAGVRSYLLVEGGIATPPALGSRATYLRGQLGGHEGRALRRDDLIPLGPAGAGRPRQLRRELVPGYPDTVDAHVVLGPQDDRFTAAGLAAFLAGPYEVLPQADRMGARLRGPRIEHGQGHDIVSDGIPLGGIQVVGDGQPIVLLVDRQSTGGYPKIATVCSFDIGRIGQLRPGQWVRFRPVSVAEAHLIRRTRHQDIETALEPAA
jgi:biotin-dependent carboxylase-like uncharacterized protein